MDDQLVRDPTLVTNEKTPNVTEDNSSTALCIVGKTT